MRESFSEYKKNLEQVIECLNYLYSGDVITSEEREYVEIKTNPLTSPNFITNSIINIYNESFTNMFKNSTELIIAKESLTESSNLIDYLVMKTGIHLSFIFCSDNSKKILGISKQLETNKSLPGYFFNIERYIGINLDVYYCPLIDDGEGDVVMYVSDLPIQSLVYTLQNMEYLISPTDETNIHWEHKMKYNFYECQYKSFRVIIRNVSKVREIKINEILNGN